MQTPGLLLLDFPFTPTPLLPCRAAGAWDEVWCGVGVWGAAGCLLSRGTTSPAWLGNCIKMCPNAGSAKPRGLAFKTISANICPSAHAVFV